MPARQPNLWAVRHHLDRIDQSWTLDDGQVICTTLVGRSDTSRSSLWVHELTVQLTEGDEEFLARVAADVSLIARCQPMNRDTLNSVLRNGSATWVDEQLPFY